jgi:putative two-component system response regulator
VTAELREVLVVDDDEQVRRLLGRMVVDAGFCSRGAASAEEARACLAERAPDLVILDLHLPGESGLSLARELAARPEGPAVVMVSGQDDAGIAAMALESGAYGYVTKPFKRNEVAIAVRDALRRRADERSSTERRARLEERVVERTAVASDALGRERHAHEEIVLRLTKAIEYRDPESGRHVDRMSQYCALLAERFDLDAEAVRLASPLHDVGKIAVPDTVLLKPAPLTAEERTVMERHAEIGHRLLRASGIALLDLAATIAWTHHERFDGTGYPRGLAGEAIPLAGRVAAVADVFDALVSQRAYRPARSVDEAVATVSAERGRQFDPVVVDAFLEDLDAVLAIVARHDGPGAWSEPGRADPVAAPTLVSLQEAATAVGVSASTLRRWADQGRISAIRTAGGHRRFPLDAVRRLASERTDRTEVRPVDPPAEPLAPLAALLRARGAELAGKAAAMLYRGGLPGWFAPGVGPEPLAPWLAELARGSESGRYGTALEATETLMRQASLQGTPLLERHRFLERLSDTLVRALAHEGAVQAELAAARRLFAALQQAQLAGRS